MVHMLWYPVLEQTTTIKRPLDKVYFWAHKVKKNKKEKKSERTTQKSRAEPRKKMLSLHFLSQTLRRQGNLQRAAENVPKQMRFLLL